MDTGTNKKKRGIFSGLEKLYTQKEVDNIVLEKEESLSSHSKEIEGEYQAANKKERRDNRTVAGLVRKSNRILVSVSSHTFPFDFFPDVLNVEDRRITIINRRFLSSEVHSVDIRNIANVFINNTIFFSQLVIVSKTFEENKIKIGFLKNDEAIFTRRIIEGLRTFVNNNIDTSKYTKKELVSKLEELSTTEIVT